MSTIYLWNPEPDNDCGAFSDEQLNERDEDVKECPYCEGKGFDDCISDCCGSTREPDLGLCYECHDHCDPSECPECDGTGIYNPK